MFYIYKTIPVGGGGTKYKKKLSFLKEFNRGGSCGKKLPFEGYRGEVKPILKQKFFL